MGWPWARRAKTSCEIGFGIDVVEFAGLDERREDGPVLATAIRSGEECILPVKSERTNGALDDVGVDLDVAIIEEAGQTIPA